MSLSFTWLAAASPASRELLIRGGGGRVACCDGATNEFGVKLRRGEKLPALPLTLTQLHSGQTQTNSVEGDKNSNSVKVFCLIFFILFLPTAGAAPCRDRHCTITTPNKFPKSCHPHYRPILINIRPTSRFIDRPESVVSSTSVLWWMFDV